MAIEKGSAFLLKVGDGAVPPVFTTVATGVVSNQGSDGWRELLSGGGVRSVSLIGSGVFTGSDAEARAKANALSGVIDDYRVSFESGETVTAKFLITRLDYAGAFNGERTYTLALESSGAVVTFADAFIAQAQNTDNKG